MPRVVGFTRAIDSLAESRAPFVVATVVRTQGSSLVKPGFKAVVSKEGRILLGTVGGVCPESAIASVVFEMYSAGSILGRRRSRPYFRRPSSAERPEPRPL